MRSVVSSAVVERGLDDCVVKVVYGHWNTGEPNNAGGGEHCAQAMWMFAWRWNDTPCHSSLACYACQTSPSP